MSNCALLGHFTEKLKENATEAGVHLSDMDLTEFKKWMQSDLSRLAIDSAALNTLGKTLDLQEGKSSTFFLQGIFNSILFYHLLNSFGKSISQNKSHNFCIYQIDLSRKGNSEIAKLVFNYLVFTVTLLISVNWV